jgi:single-stranded-DNA-specific exonuclease
MDTAQWLTAPPRPEAGGLAAELGIPPAIAQVLTNRGVLTVEAARSFLHGGLDSLLDPYLFNDMAKAVELVHNAIMRRDKILIFGDYDVDGVLSVVILMRALRTLGAEVDYYIPERLKEGYGIKDEHLQVVEERGARLVISVDCGIKAVSFARKAAAKGVEVIITDHHRPGDEIPRASAILNPVLSDSGYPFRGLAGVGVVFKLLQALLTTAGKAAALPHYAKLVAIGTIADVAELRGENRLLVKEGLRGLRNVANRGLKSLISECRLAGRKITEGDVGFRIGPRINAAGRMGAADDAVKLFFADSAEESAALAARLSEFNESRQQQEDLIFEAALKEVKEGSLDDRYKVLVLGSESWHRGVIGIVASKLKEYFYRPVILLTYVDGKASGSGRSISEFSLIECLDACRDVFLDYGGHTLAVGCSLARDRVSEFRERANAYAESRLSADDLRRKVRIDASLSLAEIDGPFIKSYLLLSPFGVGNPKPVFLSSGVEVWSAPQLIKGKHLKFIARQDGRSFEAIGWDEADRAQEIRRGSRISLAYSLQSSTYLGEERYSLNIEDIGK